MSNTILTSSMVVRDASIILADNMIAFNTINRSHEQEFARKVGDRVNVKVPPIFIARDFIVDTSTTASNLTETGVDLIISAQPYVRVDLTSAEKSLSIDDFNMQVTQPAVLALRDKLDTLLINVMAAGFARYLVGTDGNDPSTAAHLVAGRKKLQDNGCPQGDRWGLLNTTAEAALLQLVQFTSMDYGEDSAMALREAILGRRWGIDWVADQNSGTLDRGDIAGTILVKGAGQTGSSLIVDGFSATGTVRAGTRFTVAGDATVYTVITDATIALSGTNTATLSLDQALAASPADDAAVTLKAALKQNMIYHRNAVAGAVIPPAPLNVGSSVAFYNGFGIRVSMDSSIVTLADSIVFDTFFAAAVIQPKGGAVVQG